MARVVRFPRHDEAGFVLVNVISTSDESSCSLDLKLVGTEGSAPYTLNLNHSRAILLKAKNSPCTADEWENILGSVLLARVLSDGEAALMEGVESVASVEESVTISIIIRKRTEGITQRLGAIQLSYDEDQEIQLFEWCGLATLSANSLAHELRLIRDKYIEQQEVAAKFKSQLEDLITAKATHEAELLKKFCILLNEKKSKIRDQQRLLARAKVDPTELRAVQVGRMTGKTRKVGESRPGKRKASIEREVSTEGDERGPRFESMDMDVDRVPDDSDQEGVMTPEKDEETTDDDDQEQSPPAEAHNRPARWTLGHNAIGARPNVAQSMGSPNGNTAPTTAGERQEEQEKSKSPPHRQLPFPKRQAAAAATTAKPTFIDDNEGSETASEDDEL